MRTISDEEIIRLLKLQAEHDRLSQACQVIGQALLQAAQLLSGTGRAPRPASEIAPVTHWRGGHLAELTVMELVNEFLMAKARAGRSDRYLRQLRVSLKNFGAGRNRQAVDQVAPQELEKWIQLQDWAPKTARNYLSDVRTLFNFAVRRGYLERNPAAGVELPVLDNHAAIQVHSPDQVQQVLDTARRADLDVCRHLALRYFAGLRSAEAHRLREEDLKLEQNLVEVPATKSKTRARRLVTIQPNLAAWLALGGTLRPLSDSRTIRPVIRLSQVPWPHNVARHSFVSYHLAHFKKINETAIEAGHTEQVLFAHYRALVTPTAAAQYWAISPKLPPGPAPASRL